MATPAPALDNTARQESFWRPGRLIAASLAAIATVAGLIGNVQGVSEFVSGLMQPSLSGQWLLTLTIKDASYKPYVGLTSTFQVFLIQDGHNLTGNGEKIQVGGQNIPIGQHEQIMVKGELSGDTVFLKYTEKPGRDRAARPTSGDFALKVVRAGTL